jgi:hypothetical protein
VGETSKNKAFSMSSSSTWARHTASWGDFTAVQAAKTLEIQGSKALNKYENPSGERKDHLFWGLIRQLCAEGRVRSEKVNGKRWLFLVVPEACPTQQEAEA